MKKLMLAASALMLLAACNQLPGGGSGDAPVAEAPAPAPLPTQADVDALYARFETALKAKDAAAIAAMYAPGAVMVDAMSNDVMKNDPANAAAGIAEWLKTDPAFAVNAVETQILDADTVVVTAGLTHDFKRNGRPTWVVQRATDVWQKQADGQWLIVASHVSNAPRPVATRPTPMVAAAAPAPDTPPLGGSTPVSAPAPEEKK